MRRKNEKTLFSYLICNSFIFKYLRRQCLYSKYTSIYCKTSMALGIDFVGIDFNGNGKLQKAGVKNVINNFEPIEKFLELI